MRSYLVALFAIGSLLTTSVHAYELGTHSRLTQNAYEQSVISLDPQLLEDLGVRNTENPFGDRYFDVSLLSIRERGVFDEFELEPGHYGPATFYGRGEREKPRGVGIRPTWQGLL